MDTKRTPLHVDERPPATAARPVDTGDWTQRVGGLTALPGVLRDLGVDPGPLLARAGLSPDALASSDGRVGFAAVVRLLALSVQETGCAHLGLLVGKTWSLRQTGLAGELAWRSATVQDALETFTVHQRLNSMGGAAYLTRRPGTALLGFAVYHPQVAQLSVVYDLAVAAMVNGARELCGAGWSPDEVLLPRIRPDDERPYRDFFRCPVRFNSDRAALRIAGSALLRPSPGHDPARRRELERQAAAADPAPLLPHLYRSLRLLMLEGGVTADSVAQQFAMHRRTLDRRLRAHGTSFHAILSEVRYEVARQLLRDTCMPSAQVGAAIGFREAASFTRAFRQWSGMTPAAWRAAHGSGADAGATAGRAPSEARP
ncbi:MAG: AraC family transcriptional regulator [Burkholderiales bacterium]